MTTRYYSANAQPTTLSGACTDVSSTIQVSATAGFPAAPYILAVDYGTAQQELVLVTGVAGNTLTVTRGFDSSSAAPHSVGAPVRHVHSAIDFRDSRTHENSTTGVHGVSGSVVGTTDAQALSNKDLTAGTNTFPPSLATLTGAQALTNKTLTTPKVDALKDTNGNTVLGLTPVASAVNYVTVANSSAGGGLAVSASGTDANINLNLIPKGTGTLRQNGVDVATVSGTQNLTNKTLTGPTIDTLAGVTGVGQRQYATKGADQSVTSSTVFVNDSTLTLPVVANATYIVEYGLRFTCSAAGGTKAQFTIPAGATMAAANTALAAGPVSVITTASGQTQANAYGAVPPNRLVTAGAAGSITLQFAQETSDATSTVCKTNSFLILTRIA